MNLKVFLILYSFLAEYAPPLWPLPREFKYGNETLIISQNFKILKKELPTSKRLEKILDRYRNIFKEDFTSPIPVYKNISKNQSSYILNLIEIDVEDLSENLTLDTNEAYQISTFFKAKNSKISIKCLNIYGCLRGLETLSQLIFYNKSNKSLIIPNSPWEIIDFPLHKHRGIILNTANNFYSVQSILLLIESMSYNKLNVLHWHLMDSTSFSFKSLRYRKIWKLGAYSDKQTYSYKDIEKVILFGQEHGVRIIPEVVSPGNSYPIIKAFPEIGLCPGFKNWSNYTKYPPSGQLNPIKQKSFIIVKELIKEISHLFSDHFIHLNGEEINENCWREDKMISKLLHNNLTTVNHLMSNFILEMLNTTFTHGKLPIVYEDLLLKHDIDIPLNTIVQLYKSFNKSKKIIKQGYKILLTIKDQKNINCNVHTCNILNEWKNIYNFRLNYTFTEIEFNSIIGGEIDILPQSSDERSLDSLMWPKASAGAEVLWSGNGLLNNITSLSRINNWRYRMVGRGIDASSLQSLWCIINVGACKGG